MSIKDIASKGRYGDNHLLHVSDAEVQGLNALANSMYGHGLTTNPDTGLPEAFLFAPLLAPAVAGGLGLGTGALAIGGTAGVLGAAEAAARGMDDPLMQGAMAGLTAGAATGIGNAFGEMGAAGLEGATPGIDPSVAGANQAIMDTQASNLAQNTVADYGTQLGSQQTNMLAMQDAGLGNAFDQQLLNTANTYGTNITSPLNAELALTDAQVGGAFPTGVTPTSPSSTLVSPGNQATGAAPVYGTTPTTPTAPMTTPPTTGEALGDLGGALMDPYMPSDQAMAGAKKAFGSQEGFKEFMGKAQMPLAAGTVGLGGSAALDTQQSAREEMEAQDAKKKAKYDEMVNRIKANYASVGRPLPTNPYGPLFGGPQGFKEGRSVYSEAVPKPNFDEELDKLSLPELRRLKSMIQQYQSDLDGAAPMDWMGTGNSMDDALIQESGGKQVMFKEGKEVKPVTMPEPGSYLPDWVKKYAQEQQKKTDKRAGGGYLEGGIASLKGDGMSDSVPAEIDGSQPAALSTGEYVIPADVVSHLGNGSSDDGAVRLDEMLDRIRKARTGTEEQAPQIDANKYLPA